jgi:hypothetical protein
MKSIPPVLPQQEHLGGSKSTVRHGERRVSDGSLGFLEWGSMATDKGLTHLLSNILVQTRDLVVVKFIKLQHLVV